MNYCAVRRPVDHRIPEGDDRPRYVCQGCGQIHYQNPRIITGALLTAGEQVLLCRRAIEPRQGYWTLPQGLWKTVREPTLAPCGKAGRKRKPKARWSGSIRPLACPTSISSISFSAAP